MQGYGPQPPAGQQAVGVLNIVFGVLGVIFSGLAVLGGTALAVLGGVIGSGGDREAAPVGGLVAGGGIIITLLSLLSLAIAGLLIAGGVGILQMKPWGRRVTLIYAWVAIAINVAHLLLTGFSGALCQLVGLAYPIVLLVLLNQQDWKAAFPDNAG